LIQLNGVYEFGNRHGWGNAEKSIFILIKSAIVENGLLKNHSKEKENYEGFEYTSSRIVTINKGDWKYGKFRNARKDAIGKVCGLHFG
jgi:beta-glucanase (GH16 family)